MEEEDEDVISSSDSDNSSDGYKEESQDSEEENENSEEREDLAAVSPPSDADRKSKNVDDLVRCVIEVPRFQFEHEYKLCSHASIHYLEFLRLKFLGF